MYNNIFIYLITASQFEGPHRCLQIYSQNIDEFRRNNESLGEIAYSNIKITRFH